MFFQLLSKLCTLALVFRSVFSLHCISAPQVCPSEYIKFFHSSPSNEELLIDPSKPENWKQLINPEVQTAIVIHGYNTPPFISWSPGFLMREALIKNENYNLITVDWHLIGEQPCYVEAVQNSELVGRCTAQFLDTLVDKVGVTLSKVHIVGHSIGAHIAGFVSEYKKSPGLIGRITGLDPARPLYQRFLYRKLTRNDASFVDIIHTQAGIYGKPEPEGTVDFYINGGSFQPDCAFWDLLCSHLKSVKYFAESVTTKVGFYGVRCPPEGDYEKCKADSSERVLMGLYTPLTSSGIFYVKTRTSYPYALGKDLN